MYWFLFDEGLTKPLPENTLSVSLVFWLPRPPSDYLKERLINLVQQEINYPIDEIDWFRGNNAAVFVLPEIKKPSPKPKPKQKRSLTYVQKRARWEYQNKIVCQDIADRDGWNCHLCGEQIDKELNFPHPASASKDHLVPYSKGGEHTLSNLKLAHLTCNQRRGVDPL